jgi:diguanylate cyclase (GGDEF)-like protein
MSKNKHLRHNKKIRYKKITRSKEFVTSKNKNEKKDNNIKHILSPLVYDLTTKLGSEYDTLKTLNNIVKNIKKIKKYSMSVTDKLYGEIAYDHNFIECNLNGEGKIRDETKEYLMKKSGIYIKNNQMKIFSLIPYDTEIENKEIKNENEEKVILPLLSPINDKLIGALVIEGENMYVKNSQPNDYMGLLTLLATASRFVAINNEYESDELIRGIKNKRSVNQRLNFTLNSKLDRNEELWFLMIDIDFFKKINDNYGHEIGDIVLQNVGKTILDNVKLQKDEVFRYGGEEFCVIIKGDREAAVKAGERIKWFVAEKVMYTLDNEDIRVTCSIGMAEGTTLVKKYLNQGENKEDALKNGINELIRKADGALYDAKTSGRNTLIEAK